MPPSLEQFKCPECGVPYSAADRDDRRDTVACGNCRTSTARPSPGPESEWREPPADPPKHLTVKTAHGKVTLTYRHPLCRGLFRCAGGAAFGVLTLVVIWLAFGPGRDEFSLRVFAVLFTVLEGIYLFICMEMLLGKTIITVQRGKASLFRGIGKAGRTWAFLLPAQSEIVMKTIRDPEFDYCRILVPQLEGKPFQFGGGITDPETLEYIVSVLRQFRA